MTISADVSGLDDLEKAEFLRGLMERSAGNMKAMMEAET